MKKILFLLISILIFSCAEKKVKKSVKDSSALKNQITKIIAGKDATVGVSVKSFEDQFLMNINGDKHLPTLSVYKFHIALAVLNLVDEGKLSLTQKILIKKSDLIEDTHSPIREKYPEGNIELPLSEIIKFTVAQSDNNGCDILLRLIGGTEKVQLFMNEKGVKDFQILYNEEDMNYQNMAKNYSSTNSIVQLLEKFYNSKIVSKNSTDFLLKIMLETTTGQNKIVSELPKNTLVAHKTGSSGKNKEGLTIAENDMGIVTLPNGKQYAICVFVTNSKETEQTNCKMIADISKITFDFLNAE